MPAHLVPSSFRDPSGFVFVHEGNIYRQVNQSYREHFDHLVQSGLYDALVKKRLLVAHQEAGLEQAQSADAYKILQPERVPFISYPYEWSFSQLQDAALATLRIQKTAFEFGMVLKDCSAYNIQFLRGKPVFIDTLSFEKYQQGEPWVAYRQYCQHFLAPLALMAYRDVRMSQLLRSHIDGIPIDLAASLLPFRTRLKLSLLIHLHLHARSQLKHQGRPASAKRAKVSKLGLQGLVDSLESATRGLRSRLNTAIWAEYYSDTNYSEAAAAHKQELVSRYLDEVKPREVWDLGSNVGRFSRLAAGRGIPTVSIDSDPASVEANYLESRRQKSQNLLPLLVDLANPSPDLGWAGQERMSLRARGPADLAMALALIHHLVISNNTPFNRVADFLAGLCRHLIIEFVPKQDSQVERLLAARKDIFGDYTQEAFEAAFAPHFETLHREAVRDSMRTLYFMRATNAPAAPGV